MINPAQFFLIQADGARRNIIIEPILEKDDEGLHSTGVYKIYKDAFGEESSLFTEPLEINKTNNDLADDGNPDFLGELTIKTTAGWQYKGDLLSIEEQNQVVKYIQDYKN